ncbi:MAG: metal ABC transporter permease [Ruminococcaceae bacterium]|nr:metal ABC transporter permease [Oscillospiraceae bacterium]
MDLFSWWQYDFMRTALWAVLLLVPLLSLLGTMVVSNRMSFFSDALGHSALTGVAIGVVAGVTRYEWVMLAFAVVFALLMNRIRHARLASTDTVIGVFSAVGVALGLLLLSRSGSFAGYQTLLIGDILSVSPGDLWVIGGALLLTVVIWLGCFNGFAAVSISPAVARSKGIPVRLLDDLFVVLVAVVVMLSIRWVGLLLINAMLILPAAAARNVARSLRSFHLLSLLFGLFAGVLGLWLSYYHAVSTGPTIILVLGVLFFGTFFMRKK